MTLGDRGFQAERTELERVLSSEVFARSPIVAQMLKYICERHFEGRSHEVKEYNIAVEAFGRPATFDQARDSIVRVEAHRLRKRLQEYYSGPAADHEIQISVAAGSYVPQFVRVPAQPVSPPAAPAEPAPVVAAAEPAPPQVPVAEPETVPAPVSRWPRWLGRAAVVGLVAILAILYFSARDSRLKLSSVLQAAKAGSPADLASHPEDEVRILAGSDATRLVDHYGNMWSGDRFFDGGESHVSTMRPIAYTQDPVLYLHRRQGSFSYHIPLKKGTFELRLYFAETVFGENNVAGGGETTRVFRIFANGVEIQRYLDVVSDAGGSNTADIKVFRDIQPAGDGKLHLTFERLENEVPFVNAIEIIPSRPGTIRPIRIVAREAGYTDRLSQLWSADRYFRGGVLVQRHDPVRGTEEEALYQNERFGNFSYVIPVALGSRYTVNMKFCEAWFGPERPAGGGAGDRLFEVVFNGRTLLSRFDVFKEAGSLHALDETFKGLEPNQQGKLVFSFTPVVNYAMVDAIEVVDENWK